MRKRCYNCRSEQLATVEREDRIEVAGHRFIRTLPAQRCSRCGAETVEGADIQGFEWLVAGELARHGEVSPQSFSFMRRVLGLKAAELADLLDVRPETISRWENAKQSIERRAAALLASMVIDKLEGRSSTLERLQTLRSPSPLPKRVNLPRRRSTRR